MTTVNPIPALQNNFIVAQTAGLFYHHKDSGIISAIASDIARVQYGRYQIGSALTIINPKTNGQMQFILTEYKTDRPSTHTNFTPDIDILAFIFKPVDKARAKALNITELKIFND